MKTVRRLLGFLIVLAVSLCMLIPGALAMEDWSQLSVSMTWTGADGQNHEMILPPVTGGTAQAFWASFPEGVPETVTLHISHPMHEDYSFGMVNDMTIDLTAPGVLQDGQLTLQAVDAWGNPVDSYTLFFSTEPVPESVDDLISPYGPEGPGQTVVTDREVQILLQDASGTPISFQSVTLHLGES